MTLLTASKAADVTPSDFRGWYHVIFIIFCFRILLYLRLGLTDFDEINVYTHISEHAGSNGTLLFEISPC